MLRDLSIKNFAIIDDLRIGFEKGLTIMSGETGAGKSIIVNAIQLLLGARASAKLIRTGAESAELEAFFDLPPSAPAMAAMAAHGLDADEGLLVRRIIARHDRHRVFINDRQATMQLLQAITENLASISSQHAHQSLLKEDHHLDILDHYGGLMPLRASVAEIYREILPLLEERQKLVTLRARQQEQRDFLAFQRGEIEAAQLTPGEDDQLEQEQRRLRNAQTLQATVNQCLEALYSGQDAVTDRLGAMHQQLQTAAAIDSALDAPMKQLAELAYQVEDVVDILRRYLRQVEDDDQRLEEVEARLDTLNRLKRKYGGTLDDVLATYDAVQSALAELENLGDEIDTLDQRLAACHKRLAVAAQHLRRQRLSTADNLAGDMADELDLLQMPGTRFAVAVTPVAADDRTPDVLVVEGAKVDERGMDRAAFLIAPNVGEDLKPLAAIASGGELSRVVLALKAVLAASEALETVIFDEVDAGIGGGVAETVGQKLRALAVHHQVICITHLPQIAKFGDHHFKIVKAVRAGRTHTAIAPLDADERLEELARMLGGIKITQRTLDHAREMLAQK